MILLVEDNLLNQRIVTFSLKKFNHEVVIANNGVEAIEHFSERKFDVILMDIMMPVMDGLEATTKIREFEVKNSIEKRTPIIALTANTMDNDREGSGDSNDKQRYQVIDLEQMKLKFGLRLLLRRYGRVARGNPHCFRRITWHHAERDGNLAAPGLPQPVEEVGDGRGKNKEEYGERPGEEPAEPVD